MTDQPKSEDKARIEQLEALLEQEHNVRMGMKANMETQASKIQRLLHDNEELGAERSAAREQLDQVLRLLGTDENHLGTAIGDLLKWKELAQQKLGPTLEAAHQQADVLWGYVKAMESPGHRLTSSAGGFLGKSWIGRKIKGLFAVFAAVKKS